MKYLLFLNLIFLLSFGHAETYFLLFKGKSHGDQSTDYEIQQINNAHKILKKMGKKVILASGTGKWEIQDNIKELPPIDIAMENFDQLFGYLKKHLKLKKDDILFIYFVAHGFKNDSDTGICILPHSNPTWRELKKSLEKGLGDIFFQVVTETCYGGGIHSMAKKMEKFCSFSHSPIDKGHLTNINFSHLNVMNKFWRRLLENKGEGTLDNLIYSSLKETDVYNWKMGGRLSSEDFLDYHLNYPPYGKNKPLSYIQDFSDIGINWPEKKEDFIHDYQINKEIFWENLEEIIIVAEYVTTKLSKNLGPAFQQSASYQVLKKFLQMRKKIKKSFNKKVLAAQKVLRSKKHSLTSKKKVIEKIYSQLKNSMGMEIFVDSYNHSILMGKMIIFFEKAKKHPDRYNLERLKNILRCESQSF